MKSTLGTLLALLASASVFAGPTLVSNPYLPYPPACGRLPDPHAGEPGDQAVRFYEGRVEFFAVPTGERTPMTVRGYRAPCSEPGRSLVWVEFVLPARYARRDLHIALPTPLVELPRDGRTVGMNFVAEANGWGSGSDQDREQVYLSSRFQGVPAPGGTDGADRRWVFLLDNPSPTSEWWAPGERMEASEYNAAFTMKLWWAYLTQVTIAVPATSEVLRQSPPRMALSGRLAGKWVVPGATDQGLLLSFAEKVLPPDPGGAGRPMVVFLAHYTFDELGEMLWLTGAAEFQPGAREVSMPIELVTGGEFRGTTPALREVIGRVTLRSHSCNALIFQFDYRGVALGTGERTLKRPFSLETAGHDCRDSEARITALR